MSALLVVRTNFICLSVLNVLLHKNATFRKRSACFQFHCVSTACTFISNISYPMCSPLEMAAFRFALAAIAVQQRAQETSRHYEQCQRSLFVNSDHWQTNCTAALDFRTIFQLYWNNTMAILWKSVGVSAQPAVAHTSIPSSTARLSQHTWTCHHSAGRWQLW